MSFQDFDGSKAIRRYAVKIQCGAYHGQSGRFVNRDTSEALIIIHSAKDRTVEVGRKPMDKK